MHSNFERANALSKHVIGAAIEVHKVMGAGLIESIYEKCMMRELQLRGIPFCSQVRVPVTYKGFSFDEQLKLDILVDDCLIIELKAVEAVLPVHKAKLLSYMKLLDVPIGLVINFHETLLKDGICRMILQSSDK